MRLAFLLCAWIVLMRGAHADLATILTTCLDPSATGYGTFQSHNQKVVSNANGIFVSHIRTRNEAYTAQQWRLSRSRDAGKTFETIFESTNPTNPPALETDPDDNVYLVRPDWGDNNSYLYRFLSTNSYRDPLITTIPDSVHGKFAMCLDPKRRQLYYFSANNTFHVIGLDGTLRKSVTLLQPGAHAVLQYPLLDMDPQGTLFAAWTTQKHDVYMYWDIHCMKSGDGGETWQTLTGQPLTLPVIADDTGPADRISLDDEFEVHTWLSSFLVKDGKLHFLYEAQTQPTPREHYVRYDVATGKRELDISPRFGGETISICRLDGFFAADRTRGGSPLYCVGSALNDSRRVACVISRDNGTTWHDYAKSDREFGTMYAIGGCREVTRDGYVIGSFTDTPAGGNGAGVPVYFLRIPIERN